MGESEARRRSREAKGQTAPSADPVPLQISLLGHEIVLDWPDLTIAEKQTWRHYTADLGEDADAADGMMALAAVFLQRADPSLTWEHLKATITSRLMLDAVKNGKPAEADHPQL